MRCQEYGTPAEVPPASWYHPTGSQHVTPQHAVPLPALLVRGGCGATACGVAAPQCCQRAAQHCFSTAAAASASACQSGCAAAVLVAAAGARAGPVHAALLLHSAARAPHCTCRSAAAAASTHQCRQGWLCPCRGGPWRQQGHCMQCCCFAVLLACRTALAAATRLHWPGWLCAVYVLLSAGGWRQGHCMRALLLHSAASASHCPCCSAATSARASVGKGDCADALFVQGGYDKATGCVIAALLLHSAASMAHC